MKTLSKIIRPIILSFVIVLSGGVGDAWADCDDYCPFDAGNILTSCEDDDIGPVRCNYKDGHYYADFGGC